MIQGSDQYQKLQGVYKQTDKTLLGLWCYYCKKNSNYLYPYIEKDIKYYGIGKKFGGTWGIVVRIKNATGSDNISMTELLSDGLNKVTWEGYEGSQYCGLSIANFSDNGDAQLDIWFEGDGNHPNEASLENIRKEKPDWIRVLCGFSNIEGGYKLVDGMECGGAPVWKSEELNLYICFDGDIWLLTATDPVQIDSGSGYNMY